MGNPSVKPQPYPTGPLVMYQKWQRLLFLHWAREVVDVQATLPPGLTVDVWESRAWVGVIPFQMEGVRPRFFSAVPGISDFPEMNVRTYVRDRRGRPGVWFYSLDCAHPLAVWAARAIFGLPYFHARMSERIEDRIFYDCKRRSGGEVARYEYRSEGPFESAGEGTLEQFLIERYRLFAWRSGRLLTGLVWHEPYPLQRADVTRWDAFPLRQAGFDVAGAGPEHAIFSPGVEARIFGIEPV